MASFWLQYKLMMRKQWLIKKRRKCATCCEVIFPIFMFLILVSIRAGVDTEDIGVEYPKAFPVQGSMPLPVSLAMSKDYYSQCPSPQGSDCSKFYNDNAANSFVWTVTTSQPDAIGTDLTMAVRDYLLESQTDHFDFKTDLQNTFRNFSSEQAVFDYVERSDYIDFLTTPPMAIAVVLNEWDSSTGTFDYTLRVHEAALPLRLNKAEERRFAGPGNPGSCVPFNFTTFKPDTTTEVFGAQKFVCGGFLSWQLAMDQFAVDSQSQPNSRCQTASCNTPLKWNLGAVRSAVDCSDTSSFFAPSVADSVCNLTASEYAEYPMELMQMPYPAYLDDPFFGTVGGVLSLIFIFAFIYPFSQMVKSIVEEKSLGLKEGLRIVGLTDGVFWASWISTYFIEFFICACFLVDVLSRYVFTNSSGFLIFLWAFGFMLSMISMACFLSTFFSNPKIAATIGYVVFYMPFVISDENTVGEMSRSTKNGLSLFPQAALQFSANLLASAEAAQIGIKDDMANVEFRNYTFGAGIGFMYLDAFLFGILAWYFDKVLPSKYGSPRPWNFFLKKSFWTGASDAPSVPLATLDSHAQHPDLVEKSSEHLLQQAREKGVHIEGLHKHFETSGGPVHAVNNLSLDMFPGQVFGLLGHNGAGKTTTISMLCGMYSVSAGDAYIGGRSVKNDMRAIRNNMGVCPQHNILWPRMTIAEHLEIFATLKNVPKDQVKAAVQEKIVQVGLTEKANSPSSVLSGGQKRKLCVAMALIGKCDVVFLDEPTSGMDPYSRRATWNLIKQCKQDRVIVLTTHFMDEADILADRIAIMAKGQLRICGTSLFLKQKYGVGYNMTLSKNEDTVPIKPITDIVHQHLDNDADVRVLSDVGKELALRIPLEQSAKFPDLFEELDEKQEALGLDSWGLSVTTLEEVFLKVAHGGDEVVDLDSDASPEKPDHQELDIPDEEFGKNDDNPIGGRLMEQPEYLVFFLHVWALLIKRFHVARRDIRGKITNWGIPLAFMIIGMGLPLWSASGQENLKIQLSSSTDSLPSTIAVNGQVYGSTNASAASPFMDRWAALESQIDPTSFPTSIINSTEFSQAIFNLSEEIGNDEDRWQYVAAAFEQSGGNPALLMANTTFITAWPTFLHQINTLNLRAAYDDSVKLNTVLAAFPRSKKESSVDAEGFMTAILIAMMMAFIPSSTVYEVVREKHIKAKHQQLVSGVSQCAYWFSTLLWDFVNYLPVFLGAIIITAAIDPPSFTDHAEAFQAFVVTLLFFGFAVFAMMYLLSFLFSDPGKAQNIVFLGFFLVPFMLLAVFLLEIFDETHTASVLRDVGRSLFPSYALGDSLMYISRNHSDRKYGGEGESYFAWSVAGADIFAMFMHTVCYFLLTILVEYASTSPKVQQMFCNVNSPVSDDPDVGPEDSDVAAEKARILAGEADGDLVQLKGFRKVWGGRWSSAPTKVAVKDMYFSIPEGECFGFLGVNGAGKTTTLSMLSGEHAPSAGSASIAGFDVMTQQSKCRRLVGYCPQFDALFPTMTPKEHLYLYARIKGVERESLESVVDDMIRTLQLTRYANKPAGTLSGGNKRKLSVAIALIGSPKIVFLDEPSTGVDPVARRWMWNFISRTMSGRSVILTTHSMDECEALCQRIGIMVSGRLKCLGTAQHLKSKFGRGFQLDVKATDLSKVQELLNHISSKFPGSKLLENHDLSCKIRLEEGPTLAQVFRVLEALRGSLVQEYSVSQTSLEQIFINFAREQVEERDDIPGLTAVTVQTGSSTAVQLQSVMTTASVNPPVTPNQVELQAVGAAGIKSQAMK